MIEGIIILIGIAALIAIMFFGAGYLVGRSMECKEALDYIEHVYEMSDWRHYAAEKETD